MPGVSPTTAVAEHSPRGVPGFPQQVGSRAMSGQLAPGRAVAPTYICPIKEGSIFLDRKIARPGLDSLRGSRNARQDAEGARRTRRFTADGRPNGSGAARSQDGGWRGSKTAMLQGRND